MMMKLKRYNKQSISTTKN